MSYIPSLKQDKGKQKKMLKMCFCCKFSYVNWRDSSFAVLPHGTYTKVMLTQKRFTKMGLFFCLC